MIIPEECLKCKFINLSTEEMFIKCEECKIIPKKYDLTGG